MMQRIALVPIAALLLLSACVSTQATRLGSGPARPPVPPDQVAIYRTADQIPRKYEEVAMLSSKGDYNATSEDKMFESMREKAGEVGANGILLQSIEEPGTGTKVAGALIGMPANRQGKALAIFVFPDTTAKKR